MRSAASTTTTVASSPRCAAFLSLGGSPGQRREARQTSSPACGRLDRVASWVGNGVAAAFFLSLERCSCINVATQEGDASDQDAKDMAPLIRDGGNAGAAGRPRGTAERPSRRRRGKGCKRGGSLFEDITDEQ